MIISTKGKKRAFKETYSSSVQSRPAGHNRAPVLSWWNPRSLLTLRERAGEMLWPGGAIQSMMALLRLFVSSDLAHETPRCIYKLYYKIVNLNSRNQHTRSPIIRVSSGELFMIRSSSPGIVVKSAWKTLCSLLSLYSSSTCMGFIMGKYNDTYS